MPVCTTCAYPAEYLYTTYRTKSNIRLNICSRCQQFLDPLIEHPPILLILDLILLKPRVFLHLMYNRGTKPLDATISKTDSSPDPDQRDLVLKGDLLWLGMVTVVAEVLVRLKLDKGMILGSGIEGTSGLDGGMGVIWVIASVLAELLAQYSITLCLALGVLYLRGWWIPEYGRRDRGGAQKETDGRRSNFRPILIPLTLLYTSILPLLLNLLLSIWSQSTSTKSTIPNETLYVPSYLADILPFELDPLLHLWNTTDRIWAGTRLLGGMSAGFGLRVVLPTKPWETTGIVLAGWAAAGAVGHVFRGS